MKPKQKRFVLPLRLLGIAAGVVALVGMLVLMRPDGGELSEKQIAEFKEISRSSYSAEVIASIDRSSSINEKRALVTSYINKDYDHILMHTSGELDNAELQLLRARVLMNLERYEEGFVIMNAINQEDLIQKDVYLWMMAEGALGVGDYAVYLSIKDTIIENKLPKHILIISNNQ